MKEWGNGRILQVREEGVDGYERERVLGLERMRLLKAFMSAHGAMLEGVYLRSSMLH